jgi:hypothetical protein
MPQISKGWNTPYGAHKFDVLLETSDLQLLLVDSEIDPARIEPGHTDDESKPDHITGLVQFRLLYLYAEYLSEMTMGFETARDTDPAQQKLSEPAKAAAEAAKSSLDDLLAGIKAGKIR